MSAVFLGQIDSGGAKLPLYSFRVPAGFPSPAADHIERHISLDELFEIRAPHVYLVQVSGDSMQGAGIYSSDLIIVDCGAEAQDGDIVVASLNAETLCKRLQLRNGAVILGSENPKFPARHILEGDDLQILGVVKYSVRNHEKS